VTELVTGIALWLGLNLLVVAYRLLAAYLPPDQTPPLTEEFQYLHAGGLPGPWIQFVGSAAACRKIGDAISRAAVG